METLDVDTMGFRELVDFLKAREKQAEYKGPAGLTRGASIKSYSTWTVIVGSKSIRAITFEMAVTSKSNPIIK